MKIAVAPQYKNIDFATIDDFKNQDPDLMSFKMNLDEMLDEFEIVVLDRGESYMTVETVLVGVIPEDTLDAFDNDINAIKRKINENSFVERCFTFNG